MNRILETVTLLTVSLLIPAGAAGQEAGSITSKSLRSQPGSPLQEAGAVLPHRAQGTAGECLRSRSDTGSGGIGAGRREFHRAGEDAIRTCVPGQCASGRVLGRKGSAQRI